MSRDSAFCIGLCLILCSIPVSVQIGAGQITAAPHIDNRLQLWFIDNTGGLWTTSKQTSESSSNWTPWISWEFPGNASAKQVAVAPLPDRRLQLWAIDSKGKLWSTWQTTTDIDAGWTSWDLWGLPGNASAKQVAVAPLSDHRLQLWVVDDTGRLWTANRQTADPNANWTSWYSWEPPGNASSS
ncbi:MAG: hypothetical protein ACE14P_10625 [Methanotrichaceae archaeon]